ncbi:ROK family transcriptional regulator [Litorihabitans aurantiacus]|uniref:ROK family transcriptional regulator n=1 Tax=Litorihabitans aurantiacus TaxID=1930061 RepID=UPI0024E0A208|nr:ROK family transcriptional regulator [Litorihabitans aurantiacus]
MPGRGAATGSQTSLREANAARILRTVAQFGGITQVELAGATGLSPATVSTIVKQLLAAGSVETRTTTRSGRRASLVTLARRTGLAVGLQVGLRSLRVVVADVGYDVLAETVLPLPHEHRADTTLDRAALLAGELLEEMGASLEEVVGVGLALPAPVDPRTDRIAARGVLRGWEDVEVADVLQRRLDKPVAVDNDANLGALGELRFGAARGLRDVVYVRASYGVGAGIVLGGVLHRGHGGTAGEIGHTLVDPTGPICQCGSRGCLNTVVGADALIGTLRVSHGPLALRDLIRFADDGDPGCRQVLADAGATIGAVVSGVAMTANPEMVVLGGELAATGDLLAVGVRDALARRVMLASEDPVPVVVGELGVRAEVLGAVAHALDQQGVMAP